MTAAVLPAPLDYHERSRLRAAPYNAKRALPGPWLSELDAMATLAGEPAALRVLVVKRPRNPVARWWAWLRAGQYAGLVGGATSSTRPVRMELADLVFELHRAGYATAEVSA